MTKNEINIGDKVRLKEFPAMNPYYKGRVCEIASIDNNGYVTFKEGGIHPEVWELELVEHLDRKTAFLTRLQSLMREYNAKIECWQSDFESVAMAIIIGDDMVEYNSGDKSNLISVTADNIMDLDKE